MADSPPLSPPDPGFAEPRREGDLVALAGARPSPLRLVEVLAAALATALLAGLTSAAVPVALTLRRTHHALDGDGFGYAADAFSLYALAGLALGLVEAVIAGAVHRGGEQRAAGTAFLRRIASDRSFDRRVAAALVAGWLVAVIYAATVAGLAMRLVAQPERKIVGAILLGAIAAAGVPAFVLLALPVYRVARPLAAAIPRVGVLPASAVLLVAATGTALLAGVDFVGTRLDWRVLNLGGPIAASAFLAFQAAWAGLLYGPLSSLRRRLPGRGPLLGAAIAATLVAAPALLARNPSTPSLVLLTQESYGERALVSIARSLFDRDHDGYSTLLGGGDCDDHDPAIHPGARDVPDNGVDENCIGGDAHRPNPPGIPVASPAPSPRAAAYRFEGNLMIVVVDTLRADRLGVAGYRRDGRSLTPRIDELARRGVYFTGARAQGSSTPRSFPSLFASRFPSQIAWQKSYHNYARVLPDNVTMFDALHAAGYATIGIASHFYFEPDRGITRSFDEFDDEGARSTLDAGNDVASPRIVERVRVKLGALAASRRKFALFVHLFDPHSSYVEHPEYPLRLSGHARVEEAYDYEVAFADEYLGRILDALALDGLADRTLIALVSDHGEAFGLHRYGGDVVLRHGQTLYDEALRVPLVVVAPGLAPRRVDGPVMLLDVGPTLVDAVKGRTPPSFQGRSLLGAMLGDPLPPHPVWAEILPAPNWDHAATALVDGEGRFKVIYQQSDNTWELYDLRQDPSELDNLIDRLPDVAARMKRELARWADSLD